MLEQIKFLEKYNISNSDYQSTKIDWDLLVEIHEDYIKIKSWYEKTARDIVDRLLWLPKVHSVKYRIKDPERLIAKIIRNKIKHPEREFTLTNYTDNIDDIIGIRILHLYKSDWTEIGEYLETQWKSKEKPKAYIRRWDSDAIQCEYSKRGYIVEEHPHWYRSVHYIIISNPTVKTYTIEIQVRTIFEEWWSEIDHDIRYPYNINNQIFNWYLYMFNGIAGFADEMWTYIKSLQESLSEQESSLREKEDLLKQAKEAQKSLEQKISKLESRELKQNLSVDLSKISKSFDQINKITFINTDHLNSINKTITTSIPNIQNITNTFAELHRTKKCDNCKVEDPNSWLVSSAIYNKNTQFHTCPSCKKYLCNNCWPHRNFFDTFTQITQLDNREVYTDKCPECMKK